MAYYLAVERKLDEYEGLNIKTTPKGKTIFKNDSCECTLEEIDAFTTEYESLSRLAYDLYSEKKISWWSSPLAIVYVDGVEIKIEKNLLFSDSKRYLQNPDLVREYIINAYSQSDITFFKELLQTIKEQDPTRNMIAKLIENIEISLVSERKLSVFESMPVADALVYAYDLDGKAILPHQYDYNKLRRIILCITNYEQQIRKNNGTVNKRTRTKNT